MPTTRFAYFTLYIKIIRERESIASFA
jgi:hypothetical protein